MSQMLAEQPGSSQYPARTPSSKDGLLSMWRSRIDAGLSDRQRYEPQWHISQAFAAGKQWLVWQPRTRRLLLPPQDRGRERYTADVLTQHLWTAAGKMLADDLRPQLLFRRDDIDSEEFAAQANKALAYAWDYEIDADEVFARTVNLLVVFGTVAVRCHFDPTVGPVVAENVPYGKNGPILDPEAARTAVAEAAAVGETLNFRDIRGKICLEPLTPFNLIVPPGLDNEGDFPWEIVVRPRTLDSLRQQYGAQADKVQEETLTSTDLTGFRDGAAVDEFGFNSAPGKLEGHALEYKCYQRPTADTPEGMTVTIAGKNVLLDAQPGLPYRRPSGEPCSGITYFHYWRVPLRFWSKALIEPGIGPQRALNKRRSQQTETIDRGQPAVFLQDGSLAEEPTGHPMQIVRIKPGAAEPKFNPGIGPGPWMQADVESILGDLERAMGQHAATLGELPPGTTPYASLALTAENDQTKNEAIIQGVRRSVGHVVEDVMYDIRRYWPPQKQIALAGDDGLLDAFTFNASRLPTFYQVERAKGTSKPRSQGAQIQMIYDLYQQAVNIQQPLPVSWLKESLEAGKAQPLPPSATDLQRKKAMIENDAMLAGIVAPVDYFDPADLHIPIHRDRQIQSQLAGDVQTAQRIEQHIQAHAAQEAARVTQAQQMAQDAAMQAQALGAPTPGAAPGQPSPPKEQMPQFHNAMRPVTPAAGQ